jgi:diguanylate cyclase (GGDEF)-like protein
MGTLRRRALTVKVMFGLVRSQRGVSLGVTPPNPAAVGRFPPVAAWHVCLALSTLAVAAFLILPSGGMLQVGAFMVVQVGATVVAAVAVLRSSALDRWIWVAFAGGLALNVFGSTLWYVLPVAQNTPAPFPSIADALFLGANGTWLIAIGIVVKRRSWGRLAATSLDALIVTSGVGALSYAVLLEPVIQANRDSATTLGVSLAYPLVDMALLGCVVCLTLYRQGRSPIVWLLVAAMGSQLLGDTLFLRFSVVGGFQPGHWLMAAWMMAYAVLAATSLHPARVAIAEPTEVSPTSGLGLRRIALLGAVALVVPGVVVAQALGADGIGIDAAVVLGGLAALIFVSILARLAVVVRALSQSEETSRDLSLHDALTGLANRRLLIDRTEQAIAAAPRRQQAISLLMIDLDGFKKVNDELGHAAGDEVLRHVAHSLVEVIRPSDTAARLGGDEFCVLLADADEDGAWHVAKRVFAAVADPSEHMESQVPILASIGIATFRGGDKTAEDLIVDADDALYAAKKKVSPRPKDAPAGSAHHEFFADEMRDARTARIEVEKQLRAALGKGQFQLVYQPKVSLATDRMIGVEALLRWQHPVRGLVPPLDFIPLAEETGIIVPVGAWVLDQACLQAVRWRTHFPDAPPLSVAVNISGRQFDASLVQTVRDALASSGADPALLCLEVTESIVMRDPTLAIAILCELKGLGVRISIDDFGTGYSSLAYLKRFPLDELKIDKAFVDDLGRDPDAIAIVAAVMGMAHALDLTVVAEGVETLAQRSALITLGCDEAQGYYYAPPRGPDAVDFLLESGTGSAGASVGTAGSTIDTRHHNGTILLVDDAADVRHLARASLAAAGFDVREAENGQRAIVMATALRPDCVVLDLNMPGTGGIEVCRALRRDARTRDTTIVMLTVDAEASEKVAAFQLDADDYIVKPFTPRDLVSRVTAAMRRRRKLAPLATDPVLVSSETGPQPENS